MENQNTLLEAIDTRTLLCDGAMGTQLIARGARSGECAMLWNVDRPDDVLAIHAAYRKAGCDLITTNSFGGSGIALSRHGLDSRTPELNRAAAELARQAAGKDAWVLADVGPFGDFLEPFGDTTAEELRYSFCIQIEALLAGGADAVLVETMSDPGEAVVAVEAARSISQEAPVIVTYAFQKGPDGELRTMMGSTVEQAVKIAVDAGATIVGANCGSALDFADYLALARQLLAASTVPVILQPNAGAPRVEQGNTIYDATPQQMADFVRQLAAIGIRIIGGCCGTTPEHLAAMAAACHE